MYYRTDLLTEVTSGHVDIATGASRNSDRWLMEVNGYAAPQVRFHLAERSFGAFARAVRVTGAFDGGRARAVVANGVLRVVLPRIEDRRGQLRHIPVEVA